METRNNSIITKLSSGPLLPIHDLNVDQSKSNQADQSNRITDVSISSETLDLDAINNEGTTSRLHESPECMVWNIIENMLMYIYIGISCR